METPKRWTIYRHTHIESGRHYVGLTSRTMERRWSDHLIQAKRLKDERRSHFAAAIRLYGKNAFFHEVLEVCSDLEVANLAEECWIELFETRNPAKGFNLKRGGDHIPHPIRNPWDRPEYREAALARAADPVLRAFITEATRAATNAPEVRAKRSATRKAQWEDLGFRARASESNRRRWTQEQKDMYSSFLNNPEALARTSARTSALWKDPEYRSRTSASVSASLKGRVVEKARRHSATHKLCRVHGWIELSACYSKARRDGRMSHECKSCVLARIKARRATL